MTLSAILDYNKQLQMFEEKVSISTKRICNNFDNKGIIIVAKFIKNVTLDKSPPSAYSMIIKK